MSKKSKHKIILIGGIRYYGAQAEQFAFYRMPKVLFTDSKFRTLSAESKILYGILLDRVSLSDKNVGKGSEAMRYEFVRSMNRISENPLRWIFFPGILSGI